MNLQSVGLRLALRDAPVTVSSPPNSNAHSRTPPMSLTHTPPSKSLLKSDHNNLWQHAPGSSLKSWLAALLFIALPFIAANILTKLYMPSPDMRDIKNLIKTVTLIAAYWTYVRWWERRPVRELSLRGAPIEIGAGLLLGCLLFTAVIALLAALGIYSLEAVGTMGKLWAVATSMLPRIAAGAIIEEVLFRLILLTLLERPFGRDWALVLSSLLFGLAHLGNAGATPLIAVMLGAELGLLFGAAYLLTRRLWLCAALHLAWNFMQGPVFAISVSGQSGDTWLHGNLAGPAWLTGGTFGAEGSVVAVAVCMVAAAFMLAFVRRGDGLTGRAAGAA